MISSHWQTKHHAMNKSLFVGKQQKQLDGSIATIIEFYSNKNITVQFQDDYTVYHQSIKDFIDGTIEHPGLKKNNVVIEDHTTRFAFFAPNGQQYVYAKCKKCSHEYITTLNKLKYHECVQKGYINAQERTESLLCSYNSAEAWKMAGRFNQQTIQTYGIRV